MRVWLLFVMVLGLVSCGDSVERSGDAAGSGDWTFVAVTDGTTCGLAAGQVRCWGKHADALNTRFADVSAATAIVIHEENGRPIGDGDYPIAAGYRGICTVVGVGSTPGECASCAHTGEAFICGQTGHQLVAVAAGAGGCALDDQGRAECWLGSGFTIGRYPHEGPFKAIATGNGLNCGVLTSGEIECWGDGAEMGPIPAGQFKDIVASSNHMCAIRADDTVVCWGDDTHGKATAPAGRFKQLAAGEGHTCGLTAGGAIRCWGSNVHGESSGR